MPICRPWYGPAEDDARETTFDESSLLSDNLTSQEVSRTGDAVNQLQTRVRASLEKFFSPKSQLGSLRRVQALSTAADAMTTVALAGSLFFSISPHQATSNILLYLILTVVPFSILSPILSPALDRGNRLRQLAIFMSAVVRIAMALMMANDLHSVLLFPEVLVTLIASKLYLVAKSAMVPEMLDYWNASAPHDSLGGPEAILVKANAQMSLLAAVVGTTVALLAVGISKLPHLGDPWVLRLELLPLGFMAYEVMGLLRLKRRPWSSSLNSDPGGQDLAHDLTQGKSDGETAGTERRSLGSDVSSVIVAAAAMAVLRAGVGFFTFLMAFALKHAGSATYVYGLAILSSASGAALSTFLAPRARKVLREHQILFIALMIEAIFAFLAAMLGTIWGQIVLAGVVGLVAGAGKLAFDAIVQHHIDRTRHGQTFARYEMRFQFAWVMGALVPTAVVLPLRSGDVIVGAAAVVAAFFFVVSRAALRISASS